MYTALFLQAFCKFENFQNKTFQSQQNKGEKSHAHPLAYQGKRKILNLMINMQQTSLLNGELVKVFFPSQRYKAHIQANTILTPQLIQLARTVR